MVQAFIQIDFVCIISFFFYILHSIYIDYKPHIRSEFMTNVFHCKTHKIIILSQWQYNIYIFTYIRIVMITYILSHFLVLRIAQLLIYNTPLPIVPQRLLKITSLMYNVLHPVVCHHIAARKIIKFLKERNIYHGSTYTKNKKKLIKRCENQTMKSFMNLSISYIFN